MKPLRPRVVSVVAAGLGVAVGAFGLTHAFAASASPAKPAGPCTLQLSCVPVVGEVAKLVTPPGLVPRDSQETAIPAVGGGTKKIKKKDYTSDDTPWYGPGAVKVGRKITVNVIHSDKPEDVPITSLPDGAISPAPGVKPQPGTLPTGVASIQLGAFKAFVTEQPYPLQKVSNGKIEPVPVSSVGIALSPTDHILLTGEGITLAQLKVAALSLEVQ